MQASTKLNVGMATLVGINSMIGAGIFSAPATLSSLVGPAGIITYLFVLVSVWCLSFSFARMSELYPEEGSFYTYAKAWGGHTMGIITSASYLIGIVIAMGLLAKLAGIYLLDYFPQDIHYRSPEYLSAGVLTALTLINSFGPVLSQAGQVIVICCTSLPILIITILCLQKASLSNLTPFAPHGFTNALRASQELIFGFFGFESTVSLYALVENPKKNVPRALMYAIAAVSVLYFLFIFSVILAIPSSAFIDASTPLSHPLLTLFPDKKWLINIIHFSITSSFVGVLNAMLWATSTLFISLLKKMKSPFIHHLLSKHIISPASALLVMAFCMGIVAITFTNLGLFFSLTSLFIIFAFVLSLIPLLLMPSERNSWRIIRTIIGLITAVAIMLFAVERIISLL